MLFVIFLVPLFDVNMHALKMFLQTLKPHMKDVFTNFEAPYESFSWSLFRIALMSF